MWRMSVQFPEGNKVLLSSKFHNKMVCKSADNLALSEKELDDNLIDDYLLDAIVGMAMFDSFSGISKKEA